jgi:leucyl-tRNA synthetase
MQIIEKNFVQEVSGIKSRVNTMNQPKRYLITSALPYANGLKHIGHLA